LIDSIFIRRSETRSPKACASLTTNITSSF